MKTSQSLPHRRNRQRRNCLTRRPYNGAIELQWSSHNLEWKILFAVLTLKLIILKCSFYNYRCTWHCRIENQRLRWKEPWLRMSMRVCSSRVTDTATEGGSWHYFISFSYNTAFFPLVNEFFYNNLWILWNNDKIIEVAQKLKLKSQ